MYAFCDRLEQVLLSDSSQLRNSRNFDCVRHNKTAFCLESLDVVPRFQTRSWISMPSIYIELSALALLLLSSIALAGTRTGLQTYLLLDDRNVQDAGGAKLKLGQLAIIIFCFDSQFTRRATRHP